MGNNLRIPGTGEVAKTAVRTARGSGRIARRLGGNVLQQTQPTKVSPEVVAHQATLRHFKGRFGVVGNLLEVEGPKRQRKARISATAQAMVEAGLVDEHTTVELRPILPTDALRDPVLNLQRERVLGLLQHILSNEYDIEAIANRHPIMPQEHEDSLADETITWGAIATELEGWSHQIPETPQTNLAMLGLARPQHIGSFFGDQIVGQRTVAPNKLLVLRQVGELPEQNLLVEAR